MKSFVLIYDRKERKPLELRTFPDTQFEAAMAFRLQEQQRALREGLDREIVLFHADSEEALRRTHGSYFLTEGSCSIALLRPRMLPPRLDAAAA